MHAESHLTGLPEVFAESHLKSSLNRTSPNTYMYSGSFFTDSKRAGFCAQHPEPPITCTPGGVKITIQEKNLLDFFDAMGQFGAPFLRQELPKPRHEDTCAVFLPRSSERSMKAAQLLHAAGWTDFGEHLAELSLNQQHL